MTLNEYQERAMTTCMPSCDNPLYMLFEIASEAGELQGKFAKAIRRGDISFTANNNYTSNISADEYESLMTDIVHEIGDVLWGCAGLAKVLGLPLEFVAQENISKLASRAKRGLIEGNGDNR